MLSHHLRAFIGDRERALWLRSGDLSRLHNAHICGITISENADPDVLHDMETHLNRIVPDVGDPGCPTIRHTEEGPDDMASHVKSSLTNTSVSIPITNGKLAFGTWQGLWLLEHRFHGGPRRLMVTIQGSPKKSKP
ncbi:unnamed protein product [Chondrus crispus]|uniref:Secondary thiamine-phosphate synthase enzyme n=1 Tax=Chondrus crispus TaxID=2769 RepID=R7QPA5_CHOCR|nr:unnamed protein product [Chondrus crispus]CDF39316.1 unnamed protein product [Chondrus crispus]|eukprot:XP_005719227.1 unnamed protein product [Chondrus crispus]